ncbi:hypothetical protein Btru_075691 [Bulinus truncatus]|nr:hypothetical protein Btru_075691 [Bulinus truncatus]
MEYVWSYWSPAILLVLVSIVTVQCQPEELAGKQCSHQRSINLPADRKCLVPVKTAYNWITAQAACERAGGSLYQHPNAHLQSRPKLMNCLASMSDATFDDMWLNAVGIWSPHFFWINMTMVNKVNYCTSTAPPKNDSNNVPITSDTLSVDYCVSTCHDRGARFIVIHKTGYAPECYCKHELEPQYQTPCRKDGVDYTNTNTYFIIHSQEDSLIKLASSEAFSKTEILCATVDQKTKNDREMKSDTCFTSRPFLCCLGEAAKCTNNTQCSGTECRFIMRDKCMLRVSLNYNWYAARAYCVNRGGDLWNMHELNEMNQVTQFLDGQSRYWIGATNYGWSFNATSDILTPVLGNYNLARCGHMFRERTNALGTWQWGDTVCDQQKSFLCEFVKTTFTQEEVYSEVTCPWPITVIVVPDNPDVLTVAPTGATGGSYSEKQNDSLIKLASSEAFSKTEILCATVDQKTKNDREMKSDTCFTSRPFLCCLGEAAKCTNNTQCSGTECRFIMRDKCMLRVSLNYNWYAARAYCVNRGGDLWNMHELNEMNQVTQSLDGQSSKRHSDPSVRKLQSGQMWTHVSRERTNALGTWQWGDTVRDQQKQSFLCEFVVPDNPDVLTVAPTGATGGSYSEKQNGNVDYIDSSSLLISK